MAEHEFEYGFPDFRPAFVCGIEYLAINIVLPQAGKIFFASLQERIISGTGNSSVLLCNALQILMTRGAIKIRMPDFSQMFRWPWEEFAKAVFRLHIEFNRAAPDYHDGGFDPFIHMCCYIL